MKEETIILDSSDEAAKLVNQDLWQSRTGKLFVNESSARYDGCTHRPCTKCGQPAEKMYTACPACRQETRSKSYNDLPFKGWDGITPLFDRCSDEYFMDEESIINHIEEQLEDDPQFTPDSLMLVFCEPNYPRPIGIDYWEDSMPEDGDSHNFEKEVIEKLDELNALLRKHKPLSYSPGKIRTRYDYKS